MRYAPLLLLLTCPAAWAEFRSDDDFEKGKEDRFAPGVYLEVKSIPKDGRLVVIGLERSPSAVDPASRRVIGGGESRVFKTFVLKQSTDGVVDGARIDPKGRYRVVGTERLGKRTVWVLEPTGKK